MSWKWVSGVPDCRGCAATSANGHWRWYANDARSQQGSFSAVRRFPAGTLRDRVRDATLPLAITMKFSRIFETGTRVPLTALPSVCVQKCELPSAKVHALTCRRHIAKEVRFQLDLRFRALYRNRAYHSPAVNHHRSLKSGKIDAFSRSTSYVSSWHHPAIAEFQPIQPVLNIKSGFTCECR